MQERDEREPTLGEIDDFSGKSTEGKNRFVNRLIIVIFIAVIAMVAAVLVVG